jgi:hypothetical protein
MAQRLHTPTKPTKLTTKYWLADSSGKPMVRAEILDDEKTLEIGVWLGDGSWKVVYVDLASHGSWQFGLARQVALAKGPVI